MYQPLLLGHEQSVTTLIRQGAFPSHWHSEIELLYCLSGTLSAVVSGIAYRLTPGSLLVVSSLEEHEFPKNGGEARLLLVEMGFSFLGSDFSALSSLRFCEPLFFPHEPGSNAAALGPLLARLTELQGEKGARARWESKSILFAIAAALPSLPHDDDLPAVRKRRLAAQLRCAAAFEYIRQNYAKPVTLNQAAAAMGYEKSSFCKLFKSATQTSFHRYLNAYRIGIACRLLESGSESIKTVGAMVGLPEPKSFSRVFRQVMQITPTEYRERMTP